LSEVDLVEVTRDVVSQLGNDLGRSGSTLSLTTEARIVGLWDRGRLEQVVTNLLANAVKFGLGRPIEVVVAAHGATALLTVRDHGIGIPRGMQQRIFRPFERAVSDRQYGGLGLGLYIVHTIVDALGGTIHLESKSGAGTTFRVELPCTREA
jgi:signal transduction histidine kinase